MNERIARKKSQTFLWQVISTLSHRIGLAAVVGGVFSNLAKSANAILSSPNKLGTTMK